MKYQLLFTIVFCLLGWITYGQEPMLQDSLEENSNMGYDPILIDQSESIDLQQTAVSDLESGVSQDSMKQSIGLELGVNISPLLQRVISPATPFNSIGQEIMMLNLRVTQNVYWRNGFNIILQRSEDLQENQFTSSFNQSFVRSGFEWRRKLSQRLELHYGVDAIFNRSVSKFDFDGGVGNTSTTERISNGIGLGLPLGMTYWINDKIGFWVETSLLATRTKRTDINTFDGQEVSNQETNNSSFNIKLPVSIFVKMAF